MLFTALSSGKQTLCPSWGAPTRLQRKTAWRFWRSKRHTYPLIELGCSGQSQSSLCYSWGFRNNVICGTWSWTQATRATESTAFSRDGMSADCSMQGSRNRSPHWKQGRTPLYPHPHNSHGKGLVRTPWGWVGNWDKYWRHECWL